MSDYNYGPTEHELAGGFDKRKSEFDKLFEKLEAPDYPATCDQCGVEGTNTTMENHTCNEPPAPRAGEQEEWRLEYHKRGTSEPWLFCVTLPSGAIIARTTNEHDAKQIITEHNQHATLVAQRERLLGFLRNVGLRLHVLAGPSSGNLGSDLRGIRDEILSIVTTIEQENKPQ